MNILKNPSRRAQLGYNGFDMSHLLKFSSSTGHLLPVYYDILSPGDKVTASTVLKTRTMELASAAMVNVTEHLEWFFVPMTQIFSVFGDWYNGIQDVKSSLFSIDETNGKFSAGLDDIDSYLPHISAAEFGHMLATPVSQTYDLMDDKFSTYRLCEHLGIPATLAAEEGTFEAPSWSMAITPILACAYQKIWFDFYRDTDRDYNVPQAYNLDRWYSNPTGIDANSAFTMFSMRYRRARKDFFTNRFVSPVFGVLADGTYSDTDNNLSNPLYSAFESYLIGGDQFGGVKANGTGVVDDNDVPTAVSVATSNFSTPTFKNYLSPTAIRASFAVQKLLEVTRRAGKHYDAQTLAHFGVEVPTGIAGEVMYLGGTHSNLSIGDVIATATGSAGDNTSVLGQVGGKGYGYDEGHAITGKNPFVAPCHGILMCIYSAETERDYPWDGLDKLNTYLNRSDWYTPELDNLGMQPLFEYQSTFSPDSPAQNSRVMGWQYRWSELKLKYNRTITALGAGRSLDYWSVFHRSIDHKADFYCDPNELDNVMLVPYAGSVQPAKDSSGRVVAYDTDPLIHELYFDVKKASKMNGYSLENL